MENNRIDVASFKKVFLNTFFDVTLSISSKYVANIGAWKNTIAVAENI